MRLVFLFAFLASTVLMAVSAQNPHINCSQQCAYACPTPEPSDPGHTICEIFQKFCKCGQTSSTTTTTAAPASRRYHQRN